MKTIYALSLSLGVMSFAGYLFAQGDQTGSHSVEVPVPGKAGSAKQVTVLLETPRLRVQHLVLRGKTVLPRHAAEEHVVIQAIGGEGIVKAAKKTMTLDARHFVVLAPRVSHEVIPKSDVLELLVLRQPRPRGRSGRGVYRQPTSRPAN